MIDRGMGFPADGVDNHGWKLYITSLVMIISSGLFVIARCIARYSIHKLGSDDVAIIVSLISSVLLSTYIQLAIHHGYGMHKEDLEKPDLRMALKMFFIAQTPYKATVCLNKVAAILLYLRLFVTKSFRVWSFVVMGVVVGYSIGGIAATIWQCVPIKGAWDKSFDAKCIDSNKFWVAYAVLNILTDVMVLALPIMPIMRLQTSRREKLLLCCIFLLGGFVTITSILRVTSVSNSLRNKKDMTWNFIDRGVWTLIEANLGIIAACLPVLRQPMGPGAPAKGYNFKPESIRSPRMSENPIKVSTTGRADPYPARRRVDRWATGSAHLPLLALLAEGFALLTFEA
ncbi:integral membrane protein [Fusarium mexicanum]|uniref:Integral membrane protein n=1 Tax=Fusarium mexicanum TaxID=751941 RepID=A0A8H5JE70_9HYPO|nr:integral membrane protein [Fusarium mexicanum]